MSFFDRLQSTMFDTVTNVMGDDATWTPAAGGEAQSAKVLFSGPTEKEKIFDAEYDPEKLTMEYKEGVFPGLKESTDAGTTEIVTIAGKGDFIARGVKKLADGQTYKANL